MIYEKNIFIYKKNRLDNAVLGHAFDFDRNCGAL